MEGIALALAALTPLNVGLTILGGIIFGFIFRNAHIDRTSILIFLTFLTAFSIGRLVFIGVVSSTGSGLLGTILFIIYTIAAMITRRIFRRRKRYRVGHKEYKI